MYDEKKLTEIFQECLDDFMNDPQVEITDGNDFQLVDTINRIELARASKFKSGNVDSQGKHKYYMNIVNPLCGSITKNIDIDRKDIRVKPINGESDRIKAYIYDEMLKEYMRKNGFGRLLNRVSEDLPIYGSVIVKKEGDRIVLKNWRDIYIDPSVSNEDSDFNIKSRYLLERHVVTPDQLEEKSVYNKAIVEKLITDYQSDKNNELVVYEFYIDKQVAYFGTVVNKESGACRDQYAEPLYSNSTDGIPYKKVDLFTLKGRALGLGTIETNFDTQLRFNTMHNQKASSMEITSKPIFQSRDMNLNGNMLTDILPGDIIPVTSEITKIDNTERNLGAYSQEEANVMNVARSNANATEIVTGDALPSRTPFRLGALMNENAGKLFVFVRQNLALFWEEVVTDWVLPMFDKEAVKEQVVEITNSDTIEMMNEFDINARLNEAIKKYVLSNGFFPTQGEVDMIKQYLMDDNKKSFAKIPKNFLKFEKDIYIDITGEQTSVTEIETMNNMLMLLAQNPMILQDPRLMKFLKSIGEKVGIDPSFLMGQAPQPQVQQGGGMPMGTPAENASMGANQFTQ